MNLEYMKVSPFYKLQTFFFHDIQIFCDAPVYKKITVIKVIREIPKCPD